MVKSSSREGFIPLQDAVWKFAPASLKDEYWETADRPVSALPGHQIGDWGKAFKGFSESLSHIVRGQQVAARMQRFVAEKLRFGDLEARGFKTKPNMGENLEVIPSLYFDHAKINWARNIVEKFGTCFEAVEVRRAEATREDAARTGTPLLPAPQPNMPLTETKRGRPSAETRIMAAIVALDQQEDEFGEYGRKLQYQKVREYLQKAGYDIRKGFSDPVLNRCLTRYFDRKTALR